MKNTFFALLIILSPLVAFGQTVSNADFANLQGQFVRSLKAQKKLQSQVDTLGSQLLGLAKGSVKLKKNVANLDSAKLVQAAVKEAIRQGHKDHFVSMKKSGAQYANGRPLIIEQVRNRADSLKTELADVKQETSNAMDAVADLGLGVEAIDSRLDEHEVRLDSLDVKVKKGLAMMAKFEESELETLAQLLFEPKNSPKK